MLIFFFVPRSYSVQKKKLMISLKPSWYSSIFFQLPSKTLQLNVNAKVGGVETNKIFDWLLRLAKLIIKSWREIYSQRQQDPGKAAFIPSQKPSEPAVKSELTSDIERESPHIASDRYEQFRSLSRQLSNKKKAESKPILNMKYRPEDRKTVSGKWTKVASGNWGILGEFLDYPALVKHYIICLSKIRYYWV